MLFLLSTLEDKHENHAGMVDVKYGSSRAEFDCWVGKTESSRVLSVSCSSDSGFHPWLTFLLVAS